MEYEWDEEKNRSNMARHRVDFNAMNAFEWDSAVIDIDDRHDEPRWMARGFIGVVLHTVVFAERGDNIRIISLRKASPGEIRDYARA